MRSRPTTSLEAALLALLGLLTSTCSGDRAAAAGDGHEVVLEAAGPDAEAPEATPAEPTRLYLRTASVDITPGLGTVLGGYGPPGGTRKATGVNDPLLATAALFTNDAGQALLLISADLEGWSADQADTGPGLRDVRAAVVDALADAVPLTAAQVLVGASHSHSATDMMGFWQKKNTPIPQSQLEQHRAWLVQLALAAASAQAVEVRLATGSSLLSGYTTRDQACSPELDEAVGVLQARRAIDGEPALTVVSFAMHPTLLGVGNRKVSADFVWGLRTELEAATGAPMLYLQGFEAAVHEGPALEALPGEPGSFERAYAMGQVVADAVLTTLPSLVESTDAGLESRASAVDCPLTGELLIAAIERFGVPFRTWYKTEQGYTVPGVEVSWHRLGPAELIAFPGEGSPGYARKLRALVASPLALPVSQGNDALGYLVDPDEIAADTTGQLAANELKMGLGAGGGPCVWDAQAALGWFGGAWRSPGTPRR